MAVAAADRDAQRQEGKLKSYPAAVDIIYKGTLVNANTSGYAAPASDTASENFLGVAFEQCDNSGGSAGDESVRVEKTGEYLFDFSGAASQADVGKAVYVSDDHTVALAGTTTNDILCGYITEFVSASKVRVRIDGATH